MEDYDSVNVQDVVTMVVLGLLLTLTAGAVVMGGLGSLARHKNVQVFHGIVQRLALAI